MIEATGSDNALLIKLRRAVTEELDSRIERLIAEPTDRNAGYIEGLRRAISAADEIGREMNSPQSDKRK